MDVMGKRGDKVLKEDERLIVEEERKLKGSKIIGIDKECEGIDMEDKVMKEGKIGSEEEWRKEELDIIGERNKLVIIGKLKKDNKRKEDLIEWDGNSVGKIWKESRIDEEEIIEEMKFRKEEEKGKCWELRIEFFDIG